MPPTETQQAIIGGLFSSENVLLGVEASDKSELIHKLVDKLPLSPEVNRRQIAEAVLERESLLSTGVGEGVALPHAKTMAIDKTSVVFATTAAPIEFDSFDQQPVRLVFLMVGPPRSSSHHIQILGRISRILNDDSVRLALTEAEDVETLISTLQNAESKLKDA